jgi:NAD-dependent DNA ligase
MNNSKSNPEELEYRRFTSKSEADKALNSLNGLLVGISLDNVIDDQELKELEIWSKNHHELINRNPFREFMITIQEAIKNPNNRIELIEDLKWLIQKYENDSFYYNAVTSELQILQGICHGIISDGRIANKEIIELSSWLDDHEVLATYYPYDELKSLLLAVLSDGVIDDQERKRLLAYFNEFVNIEDEIIAKQVEEKISGIGISGIITSDPMIEFRERLFCFTGISNRFSRADIENKIVSLGGKYKDTVTKKTDYLIVGDNKNPCWTFACYGRKVEKAISLRKAGSQISIIHENDFWDFVEDADLN